MGRRAVTGRPTLAQVAEQAGVSIATASRALARRGRVSPDTTDAVDRAARRLGYRVTDPEVAGGAAVALRRRVAVLVGGMHSELTEGVVEAVAALSGDAVGTVVAVTGGDADREFHLLGELLADPGICGVVVVGGAETTPATSPRLARILAGHARQGRRLVFCGRPPLDDRLPERVVDYDNRGGARVAVTHLLGNGHRDILFVRGPEGYHASDARAAGYRDALTSFGLGVDPRLVRVASRDRRGGQEAIRAALHDGPSFTAVFADCDWMAVGALAALADAGIDVPGTVSVMGFDDMRASEDLRVPLTTMHIPFGDIAATAAQMVLGPDVPNRELRRTLGAHLVIRKSVAPLA